MMIDRFSSKRDCEFSVRDNGIGLKSETWSLPSLRDSPPGHREIPYSNICMN